MLFFKLLAPLIQRFGDSIYNCCSFPKPEEQQAKLLFGHWTINIVLQVNHTEIRLSRQLAINHPTPTVPRGVGVVTVTAQTRSPVCEENTSQRTSLLLLNAWDSSVPPWICMLRRSQQKVTLQKQTFYIVPSRNFPKTNTANKTNHLLKSEPKATLRCTCQGKIQCTLSLVHWSFLEKRCAWRQVRIPTSVRACEMLP